MRLPALTLAGWLRYELINEMLKGIESEIRSILEIGSGVGALSARLAARFENYVGVELDTESFKRARARFDRLGRGTLLHGDLTALPSNSIYDLICAFEVLEHYEDDASMLQAWCEYLRPSGWIMLSVPAFAHRYGPWDELAGHIRRYERSELEHLLVSTGFAEPVIRTSGFPAGYVLEFARNALARRRDAPPSMMERTKAIGHTFQLPDGFGLGVLTRLASWPLRKLQRPFGNRGLGTGFVALARRTH